MAKKKKPTGKKKAKKAPARKKPAAVGKKKKPPATRKKTKKKPAAAHKKLTREEQLAELRALLERLVRTGYQDAEDVFGAFETQPQEWPLLDAADARALVVELFEAQLARQAGWPAETDNDRLDAAFSALEQEGIVAREDYWCCMTCGLSTIGEELEEARRAGSKGEGYVFFHAQDTERAAEGEGLMLAYGAHDGAEESGAAIGRRVVTALEKAGLRTSWDGSFARRIEVALEWRRRLPT